MRFLAALVCFAMFALAFSRAKAEDALPVCDQTPAVSNGPNLVSAVKAVPHAESVDIEVTTGARPSVKSERLIMPDRIAFDIDGATMTATRSRVLVDTGGVLGVRISQFRTDPPVVRVVADLEEPRNFRVFPCAGRVVIRIFSTRPDSAHVARATHRPVVPSPSHVGNPSIQPAAQRASTAIVLPAASPVPQTLHVLNDIRYNNGLLSIHAENVTLASTIAGICRALKANVEMPAGSGQEKIFSSIGPVPPEQAIQALLSGSSLNFIFVEGHQPDSGMTLVLSNKTSAVQPEGSAQAMNPPMNPNQEPAPESVEDSGAVPGIPEPSPEIPDQPQQEQPQQDPGQQVNEPQPDEPAPNHGEPIQQEPNP